MTKHRRAPLFWPGKGYCRWCEGAIEPRLKKDGQPRAIQPSWHPRCVVEYRAAQSPSVARPSLVKRDGERCAQCGEAPQSWGPRNPPKIEYHHGRYCWVQYGTDLEVDHRIPLWKTKGMTDRQRRWYFGLENLWLLCGPCHKKKTAHEAAERAHMRRLAEPNQKPKRKRIPSRGFCREWRKRMDGTVERR